MADLFLGELVDASAHKRNGTAVRIPTSDFTTHGVIVGMTGSGKTGLGVVLIEEVLAAGIPCLLIDPKGDLTNLALTFPNLAGSDFLPWVNDGDAAKAGQTPAAFADAQATTWRDGLASWGKSAADIAALRQKIDIAIYTPGSHAGIPLNLVGSLQAPASGTDSEIVRDEIEGFVSGLLGLVGIDADPLASREHILLSNLIDTSWSQGRGLDLATLVGQVATPPIRKLGVFELDTFFPPADRMQLAMKLNGLLASSAFAAWADGDPLDIDSLLKAPDGRPRAAVITVAHLSDQERQFVVSLVLSKLVTWMRRQSGTTDLRALLYMDEVAGYLPPTAMPPTKKPIMTLMKQARAFGVGVILATQNPVDIDYKALTNAGTWMIGRLQTDRDKARLLEGMGAVDGGVDISQVDATISGLAKREFVLRRAGKSSADVFTTRWAMSYLRGPLTRDQISSLTGPRAARPAAAAAAATISDTATSVVPEIAAGIPVRYIDPAAPWLSWVSMNPTGTNLHAAAVARALVRFDDEKAGIVTDQEFECVLCPLTAMPDITQAAFVDYDDRDLVTNVPSGVTYELPEAPVKTKAFWSGIERDLVDHLLRSQTLDISVNTGLKLYSRPGESAADFATRCDKAADDAADAEAATLRDKYATKLDRLHDQIDDAQNRVVVAKSEARSRTAGSILSTAGSILGGLLGGRSSAGSIAGKVMRGAGRAGSSRTSAKRAEVAEDKVDQLAQNVQQLEDELQQELTEITDRWDEVGRNVTTSQIRLEKTDIRISQLVAAWIPGS